MERKLFNKESQGENINRKVFVEKIAQLAESLRGTYPSAAGILFALSGSLQITQEDAMHTFLIPFLTKQREMIKKIIENDNATED